MEDKNGIIRHLLDLCVRSERAGIWAYSGFLSLAEQDDFIRNPEAARFDYFFDGGYEAAERKLLAAGKRQCEDDPRGQGRKRLCRSG